MGETTGSTGGAWPGQAAARCPVIGLERTAPWVAAFLDEKASGKGAKKPPKK